MMPLGALLFDRSGLRGLQIADFEEGIAATFADIEQLAAHCRFTDCQHESEPRYAVQQAIEESYLDARLLRNYYATIGN